MEKRIKQLERKVREQEHEISRLIDICNKLKVENEELKSVIISTVQYYEYSDLEKFAVGKGWIEEDWARFDGYD